MAVTVTTANLDDGTHAKGVLEKLDASKYPRLEVIFGDNKYNNKTLEAWLRETGQPYRIEVSSKSEEKGFVPVKIRWVVEQGIACLNRYRRLSKDYEYHTWSSESWIRISAIQRMVRRLKPDTKNGQKEFKYPRQEQETV